VNSITKRITELNAFIIISSSSNNSKYIKIDIEIHQENLVSGEQGKSLSYKSNDQEYVACVSTFAILCNAKLDGRVRNNADSIHTAKLGINKQFKALVTAEMDGKMC